MWDRSERHHCPSVQKCVLLRGTVSAQHGVRQCVSQRGAVFLSVEQCVEHFPREPWEDRMPGAACAPALALLCPTLFVRPIVLLSSLWVLWYTLYKTSPVFAFKVHTGQVWVFWDQSINGQCRRRGHLRRR